MGTFLSGSSVIGRKLAEVLPCLERMGIPETNEADLRDYDLSSRKCAESRAGATVLYPVMFPRWDDMSGRLSAELATSVISFHIHDDDLWMFVAFSRGQDVGRFNPWPEYWGNRVSEAECARWNGDAPLIAELVGGIRPEDIENYFVRWQRLGPRLGHDKAYNEDCSCYGDCWQLLDFLRRCGFSLPVPLESPRSEPEPTPEQIAAQRRVEASYIRFDLDAAWRSRNYAAAVRLLEALGGRRTASENQKLLYCKKKLTGR